MLVRIEFIEEALKDYKKLDGSIKKEITKKIDELYNNPRIGQMLGNKYNTNLSGFYKIYACNRRIRIVYRILEDDTIEIVEIWGIGKREKNEIYKIVGERVRKKGRGV